MNPTLLLNKARRLVKFTKKAVRKAEDQAGTALETMEKAQSQLEKLEKRARKKGSRQARIEKETGGVASNPPHKTENGPSQNHPARCQAEAEKKPQPKKVATARPAVKKNRKGRIRVAGCTGGTSRRSNQFAG